MPAKYSTGPQKAAPHSSKATPLAQPGRLRRRSDDGAASGTLPTAGAPAGIPADWPVMWDASPLRTGAQPNTVADRRNPPPGAIIDMIGHKFYFPADADLAVLKSRFPDADPRNPSWPRIETALVLLGHAQAQLREMRAPTLVALLAGNHGAGTAKPDPDAISKAIGIFSSDPSLTDREVARRAGIRHASSLTRSKPYQRVKETFAAIAPPRGSKSGKTGDVEAYE